MVGALTCTRLSTSHITRATPSFTIHSELQRKKSPAGAPLCWGRYLIYATNAESHFGLCDFVFLPALICGGRSRRFEGGKERAFGEAARASVCGAGDDYARTHTVARALFVARSAGGARDGTTRGRDCGGIYCHAVCRVWAEAGRRSRDVYAEGAAGGDHDLAGDTVFPGAETGRGDESEAARRVCRVRPDAAGAVGGGCGHRLRGLWDRGAGVQLG